MNRELIINVSKSEITIALAEDKRLVELGKESVKTGFAVGDIYLGRVRKIMPGLNAAFVNIGHEKDAFIHYLTSVRSSPPAEARGTAHRSEEEKRAVRHVQTRTTHRQDRQDSQPAHHGTVHRGADSQRSHLHERTPAYVGHLPCREERGAHSFLEQDFHLPEDSLGGRAQAAQEDSPVDTA